MMNRAYIVDFSEPGQVADAYDHYFSNFAFLLNTPDEIKLFTQIRIRFNFPDGNGTTVVARVGGTTATSVVHNQHAHHTTCGAANADGDGLVRAHTEKDTRGGNAVR